MAAALCIMGKTLGPEVVKQLSAHVALTGKAARQGEASECCWPQSLPLRMDTLGAVLP